MYAVFRGADGAAGRGSWVTGSASPGEAHSSFGAAQVRTRTKLEQQRCRTDGNVLRGSEIPHDDAGSLDGRQT